MIRHYLGHYKSGEVIFKEGSCGDEFFIVTKGRAGIFKEVIGQNTMLHIVEPGEIFGELALINATPRRATAVALDDDTT